MQGFKTGDMVKAVVPSGKPKGTHVGKVAVKARGSSQWRACPMCRCAIVGSFSTPMAMSMPLGVSLARSLASDPAPGSG